MLLNVIIIIHNKRSKINHLQERSRIILCSMFVVVLTGITVFLTTADKINRAI